MNTFALILIILGVVAVVGFSIAFFLELVKINEKPAEVKNQEPEAEVKDEGKETQEEFDLDAMLARLEAGAKETEAEEVEEAPVVEDEKEPEQVEEVFTLPEMVEVQEAEEEPKEEPAQEEVKEEEPEQPVEEVAEEPVAEEPVVEESVEEPVVEVKNADTNGKVIVVKELTREVINNVPVAEEPAKVEEGAEPSEGAKSTIEKIKAELAKANRDINKYERTARRMARNQKLLDKKAEDLTKLNLVLYSVTDIKNIDADKKQKQEELVTHINELKVSIKDAEVYLETNREKNENALKMKEFYENELKRLKQE